MVSIWVTIRSTNLREEIMFREGGNNKWERWKNQSVSNEKRDIFNKSNELTKCFIEKQLLSIRWSVQSIVNTKTQKSKVTTVSLKGSFSWADKRNGNKTYSCKIQTDSLQTKCKINTEWPFTSNFERKTRKKICSYQYVIFLG